MMGGFDQVLEFKGKSLDSKEVLGLTMERNNLIRRLGSLSKNAHHSNASKPVEEGLERPLTMRGNSVGSPEEHQLELLKGKSSEGLGSGLEKMHGTFDEQLAPSRKLPEPPSKEKNQLVKPIYSSREGNKSSNVSPRSAIQNKIFQEKYLTGRKLGDESYQRHSVVAAASTKDSINVTNNPSTSVTKSNSKKRRQEAANQQQQPSFELLKMKERMNAVLAQYKCKMGSLESENAKLKKELQKYKETFPGFL